LVAWIDPQRADATAAKILSWRTAAVFAVDAAIIDELDPGSDLGLVLIGVVVLHAFDVVPGVLRIAHHVIGGEYERQRLTLVLSSALVAPQKGVIRFQGSDVSQLIAACAAAMSAVASATAAAMVGRRSGATGGAKRGQDS